MPTSQNGSHPALLHPFPFLTVWQRRVMDLLAGGQYGEAAQIFATKIHPLKNAVTARISSEKLHDEIGKIERSVGSKMSVYHAHCGTVLMKKLISDYLRFYLPDSIGYVSPKGKQSAMWEFALRLDPPVLGVYKSHADIRCLLCSEQEYTNCNIGVKMEGHIPDSLA
nr:uncharacterized protein LOC127348287 [Lolium perenne]